MRPVIGTVPTDGTYLVQMFYREVTFVESIAI
jgi:hypothetical protein